MGRCRAPMGTLEQELKKLDERASQLQIHDAKFTSESALKRNPLYWIEVEKCLRTKGLLLPSERNPQSENIITTTPNKNAQT